MSGNAVLVGAGDIAECGNSGSEQTAQLLDRIDGTVFTAGDNAYEAGTMREYHDCYDRTWGRHKARTRPAPGNHEYNTPDAAPYYAYFGALAGSPGLGYYSYEAASWHIVSLNSNVASDLGSPQYQWLQANLAASRATCTLAYWHHPVFSSGEHGNDATMRAIWRLLFRYGVDLVVNGHDHDYERFAPQDADGRPDPVQGIREIVSGTGGKGLRTFPSVAPNSEVRGNTALGVLKLTLRPGDYDWDFVPVAGGTFRDAGSGQCRGTRLDEALGPTKVAASPSAVPFFNAPAPRSAGGPPHSSPSRSRDRKR
jgi:hypothetical protein